MRKALPVILSALLLGASLGPSRAQPAGPAGPEVLRGLVVAGPVDAATRAAFSDALLDMLADKNAAGQVTLLAADTALCRASGITAEHFASLAAAPPEQAGALLLLWGKRLYLSELVRVTLATGPQGSQAEVLWARLKLGQVRQVQAALTQPLTKANAGLLAGKVAQTIKTGWEMAGTVTSSGNPPPPEAGPEVRPAPPATPPLPPAPPAPTPPTPAVSPSPATPQTDFLTAARKALQEGNATRALALIASALQAEEDRPQALLLRAQCYATLRSPDLQRESLAAAIAADKSLYEPRLMLAALERDRGLWQSAATMYRDAIAVAPTQAAAYVALSSLYLDQRLASEALKVLQEGAQAAPEDLSLLYVLAGEYKRRGTLAAAEETYAKLAALAPGAQKATALQELGRIYINAGQFAAAFEALKGAAQYAPAGQAKRYAELFVACDRAVGQSLDAAFSALADLDRPTRPAPREEVFEKLGAAATQIKKIEEFAAPLELPDEEQLGLAERQLYYSRAAEAVTYALRFVDTGEADLKTRALQRRQEAAAMPATWATPAVS